MAGCPRCGKNNPHRANFCMFCGHNLQKRTIKIEGEKLRHLNLKRNQMFYRLVVSVVVAGFLFYLLAIIFFTDYYADYFGRGVSAVLMVLFVAAVIGIVHYYRHFRQTKKYLLSEIKRESTSEE
jgi:uncharacterized membrane protein YvbJ